MPRLFDGGPRTGSHFVRLFRLIGQKFESKEERRLRMLNACLSLMMSVIDAASVPMAEGGSARIMSLADEMVRRADHVPYYLQALGSWTFNATTGRNGKSVSQADIDEGFVSLYSAERILLENTFIAHPQSQRLLMRALAIEPASTFPEGYRRRHALASTSTVNTALRRLLAESTVDLQDGFYRLEDPILAHHLSSQATI